MTAKDYTIAVGNFGSVYIAKKIKNKTVMSSDRVKVENSDFIRSIIYWALPQIEEGEDTVSITVEGRTVVEVKLFPEMLKVNRVCAG